MAITFDPNKAMSSDSKYVNESGAYVCTIIDAFLYQPKKENKSLAVRFELETVSGALATTDLYIKGKEGQEIFGIGFVHAMMGLLNIQSLDGVTENREVFRKPYKVKAWKSLIGKQLGFALLDERLDGKPYADLKIKHVFDPQTQKTYTEKAKGTEAKKIPQFVESLVNSAPVAQKSAPAVKAKEPDDFSMDEDVPF